MVKMSVFSSLSLFACLFLACSKEASNLEPNPNLDNLALKKIELKLRVNIAYQDLWELHSLGFFLHIDGLPVAIIHLNYGTSNPRPNQVCHKFNFAGNSALNRIGKQACFEINAIFRHEDSLSPTHNFFSSYFEIKEGVNPDIIINVTQPKH